MKPFSRSVKRIIAAGVAVGILAMCGSLPAFAAADTGVAIAGGTLSGGAITWAPFTGVTLDGTQQTTTASWSIANIIDSRGTGVGWHESLILTQLAAYNTGSSSYVDAGKTLATSSIKVTTAPVVTLADDSSSAASTVTPITTTTALDTGVAVPLVSASDSGGGMGSYAISDLTATLTIPANAYAATYKTDATVSRVTGP